MNGNLDMTVFNVERGNAIWISLPDGKNLMFDIGCGRYNSPLTKMLSAGVSSLDGLIITHPHTDHFDDIDTLDKNFGVTRVGCFLRPTHLTYSDIYAGNTNKDLVGKYWYFNALFRDFFETKSYVTWDIGRAHLDIFRPHKNSASNLNNHSLVTFVSYCGYTILLPGDCENAAWNELMEMTGFMNIARKTNIFVVPHHGLASAYNENFMASISPDVCIISEKTATDNDVCSHYSGKCNGHPATIRGVYSSIRRSLTTRSDGNIQISIIPGSVGAPYYAIRTFD